MAITVPPLWELTLEGTKTGFHTGVRGGQELYRYQWQYTDDTLGGVYRDIGEQDDWASDWDTHRLLYVVQRFQLDNHAFFRCVITDANGNTIATDPMPLREAMHITQEPESAPCTEGESVSFHVKVQGGTPPYRYRWSRTIFEHSKWNFEKEMATGWDTDTLTIPSVPAELFGELPIDFFCIITDSEGAEVASARVRAVHYGPLWFRESPANATAAAGETAVFHAQAAGGSGSYSYRWEFSNGASNEWQAITAGHIWATGGETDTLSVAVTQELLEGNYRFRCIIADTKVSGSTLDSSPVSLLAP